MKYFGVFLLAVGICLLLSKRKSDKGQETWESKHGIAVKAWQYILCIVLGIICIFGSNFHANFSVTDKDGNKKEVASIGNKDNSSDAEEKTTDTEKKITKEDEKETAGSDEDSETVDSTTKDLKEIEKIAEKEVQGISSSNTEKKDVGADVQKEQDVDQMLEFGDGFKLYLGYTGEGEFTNSNNITCNINNDNGRYVTYTDSFLSVDDADALTDAFVAREYPADDIHVYSLQSGKKVYADLDNSHEEFNRIQLYEEVGASTFLSVQITDYTSSYSLDELASAFAIEV